MPVRRALGVRDDAHAHAAQRLAVERRDVVGRVGLAVDVERERALGHAVAELDLAARLEAEAQDRVVEQRPRRRRRRRGARCRSSRAPLPSTPTFTRLSVKLAPGATDGAGQAALEADRRVHVAAALVTEAGERRQPLPVGELGGLGVVEAREVVAASRASRSRRASRPRRRRRTRRCPSCRPARRRRRRRSRSCRPATEAPICCISGSLASGPSATEWIAQPLSVTWFLHRRPVLGLVLVAVGEQHERARVLGVLVGVMVGGGAEQAVADRRVGAGQRAADRTLHRRRAGRRSSGRRLRLTIALVSKET